MTSTSRENAAPEVFNMVNLVARQKDSVVSRTLVKRDTGTIAGEPYTVKGGEAIILPAGRPHALDARTAFKMLLAMVRS